MHREWILVACPTRARLLERVVATGSLRPVCDFLEDDLPGRPADGAPPLRRSPAMSPQRRRHLRFAGLLAGQLADALVDEGCDRLTLVSGCPFMGALRLSLGPALRRALTVSVNIDMVDEPLAAIAHELARHRFDGAAQSASATGGIAPGVHHSDSTRAARSALAEPSA